MLSNLRIAIILLLFGCAFWVIQISDSTREVPVKKPLSQFPEKIGDWKLVDSRLLSDSTVAMLGVDDYIEYNYQSSEGITLNLYVSYFSSVGTTGGYHSPRNCLPGGGWQIASIEPLRLNINDEPARPAVINSMLIQNGVDQQLALYWFQNRGRTIASEYWEKIYLVWDAVFKKRRDGSFIRIMAPVPNGRKDATESSLKEFAEKTLIILDDFIPGNDL